MRISADLHPPPSALGMSWVFKNTGKQVNHVFFEVRSGFYPFSRFFGYLVIMPSIVNLC